MLTVYRDQNETEMRGRGLQVACARVYVDIGQARLINKQRQK